MIGVCTQFCILIKSKFMTKFCTTYVKKLSKTAPYHQFREKQHSNLSIACNTSEKVQSICAKISYHPRNAAIILASFDHTQFPIPACATFSKNGTNPVAPNVPLNEFIKQKNRCKFLSASLRKKTAINTSKSYSKL